MTARRRRPSGTMADRSETAPGGRAVRCILRRGGRTALPTPVAGCDCAAVTGPRARRRRGRAMSWPSSERWRAAHEASDAVTRPWSITSESDPGVTLHEAPALSDYYPRFQAVVVAHCPPIILPRLFHAPTAWLPYISFQSPFSLPRPPRPGFDVCNVLLAPSPPPPALPLFRL